MSPSHLPRPSSPRFDSPTAEDSPDTLAAAAQAALTRSLNLPIPPPLSLDPPIASGSRVMSFDDQQPIASGSRSRASSEMSFNEPILSGWRGRVSAVLAGDTPIASGSKPRIGVIPSVPVGSQSRRQAQVVDEESGVTRTGGNDGNRGKRIKKKKKRIPGF